MLSSISKVMMQRALKHLRWSSIFENCKRHLAINCFCKSSASDVLLGSKCVLKFLFPAIN